MFPVLSRPGQKKSGNLRSQICNQLLDRNFRNRSHVDQVVEGRPLLAIQPSRDLALGHAHLRGKFLLSEFVLGQKLLNVLHVVDIALGNHIYAIP